VSAWDAFDGIGVSNEDLESFSNVDMPPCAVWETRPDSLRIRHWRKRQEGTMSSSPPSGAMVYWRFKTHSPGPWKFGYVTYESGNDLIRLGLWNGEDLRGPIVSASEIEWKAK